jgi:hypothetical protein
VSAGCLQVRGGITPTPPGLPFRTKGRCCARRDRNPGRSARCECPPAAGGGVAGLCPGLSHVALSALWGTYGVAVLHVAMSRGELTDRDGCVDSGVEGLDREAGEAEGDGGVMGFKLNSCRGLRERGQPRARARPSGSAPGWELNGLNLRRAPRDASATAWSGSMVWPPIPTLYVSVCYQEPTPLPFSTPLPFCVSVCYQEPTPLPF